MARIMIENLFKKTLDASDGSKTLLEHFQDHHIDWMQGCGRKGRCTTCKVIVKAGMGHFQKLTAPENRYRQQGALQPDERLACQARISGDICVFAPREYQLPHILYSEED